MHTAAKLVCLKKERGKRGGMVYSGELGRDSLEKRTSHKRQILLCTACEEEQYLSL